MCFLFNPAHLCSAPLPLTDALFSPVGTFALAFQSSGGWNLLCEAFLNSEAGKAPLSAPTSDEGAITLDPYFGSTCSHAAFLTVLQESPRVEGLELCHLLFPVLGSVTGTYQLLINVKRRYKLTHDTRFSSVFFTHSKFPNPESPGSVPESANFL